MKPIKSKYFNPAWLWKHARGGGSSGSGSSSKVCSSCNTSFAHYHGLRDKHCKCSLQLFILTMHLQYAASSTDRDFTSADMMDFTSYSPNQLRKMVHTIELTLEGKEKGGRQFASVRKSMKRTGKLRQSLRRKTDKADHYFMGHPDRGLHLLFAQEKFDESSGQKNRPGTAMDITALKVAMGHLDFRTLTFKDLTVAEIRRTIAYIAQEVDHSRSDCLAVTILSHGDETRVWGRDGSFSAEELWKPFEGDRCPSLADKPKIFISNTCQGLNFCSAAALANNNRSARDNEEEDDEGYLEADSSPPPSPLAKIPTKKDFLWAFSTCPGDVSFRHSTLGSFFIQALCKVIEMEGTSAYFTDVLTKANRNTLSDLQRFSEGEEREACQMPITHSTLDKKLKFTSKLTTSC